MWQSLKFFLLVLSLPLLALFLAGAFFNAKGVWMSSIRKQNSPSPVPLLPGIAGAVAFVLFPLYPLARLFWLPLLLDVGCLPYFLVACAYLTHDWWITRPSSLAQELYHRISQESVIVRLYRTGQFRVKKENLRPPPDMLTEPHWLSRGDGGTWRETAPGLQLQFDHADVDYERDLSGGYTWKSSTGTTLLDYTDLQTLRKT